MLTSLSTYLTQANYSAGLLCVLEEGEVVELLVLEIAAPLPVTSYMLQINISVFQRACTEVLTASLTADSLICLGV